MACPAKFRTLAEIDARLFDRHGLFVETAGNSVKLEPQCRHRKAVDHVSGGGLDADGNAGRNDHAVIHGEEARTVIVGAVTLTRLNSRLFLKHVRDNFEAAMVGIGVTPIPLISRHLHGNSISRRRLELLGDQRQRGISDTQQDENGDERPHDFDEGVVGGLRRFGIGCAAVAHDNPKQQTENEQRNDRDDRQQDRVVHPLGIMAIGAELFLEIDAAILGHADMVFIVGLHRRVAGERAVH